MKKRFAIAMLVLLIFGTLPGVAQDRVDLIVLLDSSQSMIPYYNQVVDYVLSQTVREYMRFGDAFHLLSFSDSTQVEIAQVLKTEQDLKSVIARLYLLYPLGKNTDLVTALKNVYQYVADLPESSAKYIVLITDGMHSPAPRSPFAALDAAGVKAEIDRVASDIRAHGWTMRIVRVPFDTNGASTAAGTAGSGTGAAVSGPFSGKEAPSSSPGSGDYLSEVAAAVGTVVTTFDPQNSAATINDTIDLPVIDFPSDMGVKDYAFTIPVEIHNRSSRQISIELTRLLLEDGTDILTAKEFAEAAPGKSTRLILKVKLPGSIPAGATTLSLEPRFGDGLRVSPGISHVKVELKTSPLHVFFRSSFRIIMFIALLVIASAAVLLVVLYVRTLHRKTEEPIVDAMIDSAHSVQVSHSAHVSPYAKQAAEMVAVSAADEAREQAAILAAASGTGQHQRAQLVAPPTHRAAREDALATAQADAHAHERKAAELLQAAQPGESSSQEAKAAAVLGAWQKPGPSRRSLPLAASTQPVQSASVRATVAYEPRIQKPGAARLMLHVADQNPNIGRRNIHAIHAGGKKSIGGGSSDFLIFLLPVPRNIASVYFDGVNATLVPIRPEFFPDLDGPSEECIGKDFRVLTARGKELRIRLDLYEPPVDRINKLLHCLESPGMPGKS
ncbi:MAG TPA: VWA domain-containing protein [bacterium]|nr:VWA domain-containing protein [bacterium]